MTQAMHNETDYTVKIRRDTPDGQSDRITSDSARELPANCVVLEMEILEEPEPIKRQKK